MSPIPHDKQPAEDDLFAVAVGNSRDMTELRHAVVPRGILFPGGYFNDNSTIIFAPLGGRAVEVCVRHKAADRKVAIGPIEGMKTVSIGI